MNNFTNQIGKNWAIKHRPFTSWLLFKWGKDVFDNQDQKILSIEHTALNKFTNLHALYYSFFIFALFFNPFMLILMLIFNQEEVFTLVFNVYFSIIGYPVLVAAIYYALISPFLLLTFRQKKFVLKDKNRKLLGTIRCNWRNSEWKITDQSNSSKVTIFFTKKSTVYIESKGRHIYNEGEIEAPFGSFTLSPQYKVFYEGVAPRVREVTVRNVTGTVSFIISRIGREKWWGNTPEWYTISITSVNRSNLFFYLAASFCIVEKMLSYREQKGGGWD